MANYSSFSALVNGAQRTVNLSSPGNVLELGGAGLQMDGSTSGHIVIAASATTTTYSLIWPSAQAASSGYTLSNDGTGVLTWVPASTGSVTAISVVSANGFAGTSSGGSTPALTLSTTITGILQGNGTAISAASTTGTGSVVLATSPTLVTPNLGTPSTLVGTNITGTAAGLTAGTVTTNANLTGDVTSVGNATTLVATTNSTLTTLSALVLPASQITGTLGGTHGGTGLSSVTQYEVMVGGASSALAQVSGVGTTGQVLTSNGASAYPTWQNASAGTVTSVAFADDSTAPIYSVSGSPVTSSGTLAITLTTQTANTVFAGPSSGSAAQPAFRALVASDIPSLAAIYLSLSGGTMSGAINMGGNQINALANPTSAQDAATKSYVDAAINGLYWQGPAQAYAASNVPLTGAATLTIDGYAVQNGDLVLLGNQTTASQNGEYSASGIGTAYTLTPNGLPTAAGDAWLVLNGTVYADSAFVATAAVPAAAFIEFAGPTAYSFTAPLSLTGHTVSITQSTTSTDGYLSSTDWNTFNNKQPAGSYITALTGDATASGPGSAALTLATVATAGTTGSSTAIPVITINAKGLTTSITTAAVVAPAGTLSGTTLASNVVSSSLTSVGTITSGTWNGTAIDIAHGGTGQTSAASAFNALAPSTATGGLIVGTGTNTYGNLAIGTTGQVLTVAGGTATWAAPAVSPSSITLTDNHILVGNASNLATDVAMSGDVAIVASGATTIESIQGTTVSGTTGTGNVVFSASPTLTGTLTAAAANFSGAISATNFSGSSSGTNTGDQTITLTGPVTGSGTGSFATTITAGAVGTTQLAAASVTAAKLATITDNVTLDQAGTGSTLEIKNAGVSATQLATGAFDQVTITGGAGTAASVAQSPSLKRSLIAGTTFTANTSYAVRWGVTGNGETATRVYPADITTSSFDLFYVIGMVSGGAGGVTAGNPITVTTIGSFVLSSADTAFGTGTEGTAVFLTATGTFSLTAPSSSGQAVTRIGIVQARSATVTSNIIDVMPSFVGVN